MITDPELTRLYLAKIARIEKNLQDMACCIRIDLYHGAVAVGAKEAQKTLEEIVRMIDVHLELEFIDKRITD